MKLVKFVGQDYFDDIKKHHQIIYLINNDKQSIKVIDLPRMWMKNQNLYYLPHYDVVGDINTLLQFEGIKDGINNAITGYNYENSDVFEQKINEFDNWMIKTMIDYQKSTGQTIDDLLSVTNKPIENTTNKTIIDKLNQLPFGKYMDVSNLNNIKYLNVNKKKFVATNIRIQSNNYDNFNYVINILPNGVIKYAEDLQKAQIYFNINKNVDYKNITIISTPDIGVPNKPIKKYEKQPREKPYINKLNTITANKVVDVSNIDKKGNKTIVIDKKDVPDTYYNATDLSIVSNNYESFLTAIELLPNGPVKYSGDIVLAKLFFGIEESSSENF